MYSFDGRKRRFHRNNPGNNRHQNNFNSKRHRYHQETSQHPIIERVQLQKGIRGQLVLFQSGCDVPYTVLQNAVDRINGLIKVSNIEKTKGGSKYRLEVNNEVLAEELYESLTLAKRGLAELAIENLRKSCFTILRKIHPRDSPKVDLPSPSCSENSSSNPPTDIPATNNIKGIGAKIMLQMGWSGGGLGTQEQGRTSIIQPYIQIQRQGLGTKNIVQEVTKVLQDYAASGDINSIAFSPDFTKEERVVIHEVARKLNLKSRSYGKDSDRVLVVQSKVRPWDLVHSLLDASGENDQLKLMLPTDFESNQ